MLGFSTATATTAAPTCGRNFFAGPSGWRSSSSPVSASSNAPAATPTIFHSSAPGATRTPTIVAMMKRHSTQSRRWLRMRAAVVRLVKRSQSDGYVADQRGQPDRDREREKHGNECSIGAHHGASPISSVARPLGWPSPCRRCRVQPLLLAPSIVALWSHVTCVSPHGAPTPCFPIYLNAQALAKVSSMACPGQSGYLVTASIGRYGNTLSATVPQLRGCPRGGQRLSMLTAQPRHFLNLHQSVQRPRRRGPSAASRHTSLLPIR